jgi:hypothetical protein
LKAASLGSICCAAVSGVFFFNSAVYWAAPYDCCIEIGQEGFYALFAWLGSAFLCVSGVFLFYGRSRSAILAAFRTVLPIILLGVLVALGTGWITIGGGALVGALYVSPGGIIATNYGFPFTWKIVQTSCPRPCIQANDTVFNPVFLALDSGFFTVIACSLVYLIGVRRKDLRSSGSTVADKAATTDNASKPKDRSVGVCPDSSKLSHQAEPILP